jgi:hypothetical protein
MKLRIGRIGATVAFGSLLFALVRGSDPAATPVAASPDTREPAAPSSAHGAPAVGTNDEAAPVAAAASPEAARHTNRRVALQHKVDATDPELGRFNTLAQKVIRTKEENAAFRALLANPAMIDRARADLEGKSEHGLDPVAELRRMNRVDFLATALAWKDNPQHDRARDTMLGIVRDEGFKGHPEEDLRKSLASDRIELVRALGLDDPASAHALWDEAAHSGQERFLRFAVAYAMASVESK